MKVKSESEVAQSCPTLSNPMDCSLPGSSAHGIFQARVLEWGAIAFSISLGAAKCLTKVCPHSLLPCSFNKSVIFEMFCDFLSIPVGFSVKDHAWCARKIKYFGKVRVPSCGASTLQCF